jgi:3'-5' exonuclease
MFSRFDDKNKYDGGVPNAWYLLSVHKQICEDIRPHLDRERQKVSCDHISVDDSYKVPKNLARIKGESVYNSLITTTNEIGLVRLQFLAGSEAHEQMKAPLDAFSNTNFALGYPGPRLVFCDNPVQQKALYLERLPSVRAEQERLNELALRANERLEQEASATPPIAELNCGDLDAISVSVPEPTMATETTRSARPGLENIEYQVVTADMISSKVTALSSIEDRPAVIALDCEWDTKREAPGSHLRKSGLLALMQIAFRLNGKMTAMLLKLPRSRSNEKPLKAIQALLTSSEYTFVGVRVKNDIDMLGRDFLNDESLSNRVKFIDLSTFARNRDMVQRGNASMKEVVQSVLGEELEKAEYVRCSKWSSTELSNEQVKYAVLDVVKPLEVFEKLAHLPDLTIRLHPNDALAGLVVDIVPPNRRGGRPGHGFRSADMMTRAVSAVSSKAIKPDFLLASLQVLCLRLRASWFWLK